MGQIVLEDMIATYNREQDLWGIYPLGAEQIVGNLLAVVHGNDRNEVKETMTRLYNERFSARKGVDMTKKEQMQEFWLFLDDEREPPEGKGKNWVLFRTVGELIEFILVHPKEIAGISFDHDLGLNRATGMQALNVIHSMVFSRVWNPERKVKLSVHSDNSAAVPQMKRLAQQIEELVTT